MIVIVLAEHTDPYLYPELQSQLPFLKGCGFDVICLEGVEAGVDTLGKEQNEEIIDSMEITTTHNWEMASTIEKYLKVSLKSLMTMDQESIDKLLQATYGDQGDRKVDMYSAIILMQQYPYSSTHLQFLKEAHTQNFYITGIDKKTPVDFSSARRNPTFRKERETEMQRCLLKLSAQNHTCLFVVGFSHITVGLRLFPNLFEEILIINPGYETGLGASLDAQLSTLRNIYKEIPPASSKEFASTLQKVIEEKFHLQSCKPVSLMYDSSIDIKTANKQGVEYYKSKKFSEAAKKFSTVVEYWKSQNEKAGGNDLAINRNLATALRNLGSAEMHVDPQQAMITLQDAFALAKVIALKDPKFDVQKYRDRVAECEKLLPDNKPMAFT